MAITDPPTPEVEEWLAANRRPAPLTEAQLDRSAARLRNARDRSTAVPKDAA